MQHISYELISQLPKVELHCHLDGSLRTSSILEQAEIDIISQFLPKQMTDDETEALIIEIIKKNNFNSVKDMGFLMKNLKNEYSGTIDMAVAGKIAKSKLSN